MVMTILVVVGAVVGVGVWLLDHSGRLKKIEQMLKLRL